MRVCCLLAACFVTASVSAQKIKFTEYRSGFTQKEIRISKIKQLYFVFEDFKSFAEKFDAGTNKSRFYRSPKIDASRFNNEIVIGALKVGKVNWQIAVQRVSLKSGVLEVHHRASGTPSRGLIRSARLLISVPKKGIKSVQFHENGKLVKTLNRGG